jgi:hypothetical protein
MREFVVNFFNLYDPNRAVSPDEFVAQHGNDPATIRKALKDQYGKHARDNSPAEADVTITFNEKKLGLYFKKTSRDTMKIVGLSEYATSMGTQLEDVIVRVNQVPIYPGIKHQVLATYVSRQTRPMSLTVSRKLGAHVGVQSQTAPSLPKAHSQLRCVYYSPLPNSSDMFMVPPATCRGVPPGSGELWFATFERAETSARIQEHEGWLVVSEVQKGGQAQNRGVQKGDRLMQAQNTDVSGFSAAELQGFMEGQKLPMQVMLLRVPRASAGAPPPDKRTPFLMIGPVAAKDQPVALAKRIGSVGSPGTHTTRQERTTHTPHLHSTPAPHLHQRTTCKPLCTHLINHFRTHTDQFTPTRYHGRKSVECYRSVTTPKVARK